MHSFDEIYKKIDELQSQLSNFSNDLNKVKDLVSKEHQRTLEEEWLRKQQQLQQPIVADVKQEKELITPIENVQQEEQKSVEEPVKQVVEEVQAQQTIVDVKVQEQEVPVTNIISPKPKQKTDLEKFIGENLFSKIGIGVLVLGIGFFVKYAIDKNWINELFRMIIGILAGFSLIGISHWLRKDYKTFSSVLVGGGIAVLYFTFAIAFHEYKLISQAATFIIMVLVTGLAVALSLSYDRRELAIIALIGGYATPFMVSDGAGKYIVFHTYLLILNSGMLVLSYYKNWKEINIIAFFMTFLIFFLWYVARVKKGYDPYSGALIFAAANYVLFFAMNIVNNITEKRKFNVLEIIVLIINTFYFFTIGMDATHHIADGQFQGLFTASLGAFNLIFAIPIYRNTKIDRTLAYLLLGFVVLFISLIAPIQLKGASITLFWAAEIVLLYWLSQKSAITMLKAFSFVVLIMVLISLIVNWSKSYYLLSLYEITDVRMPTFYNRIFFTGMFVSAVLFAYIRLIIADQSLYIIKGFSKKAYQAMVTVFFFVTLFFTLRLELNYQLKVRLLPNDFVSLVLYTYNLAYLAGILFYCRRYANKVFLAIATGMTFFVCIFFMVIPHYDIVSLRNLYFFNDGTLQYFYFHYLTIALLLLNFYQIHKALKMLDGAKNILQNIHWWFITLTGLFVASASLDHHVLLTKLNPGDYIYYTLDQTHRIGYPVLWGVTSFVIMFFGMKRKMQMLRIISLSVFIITLLKLFIYDIQDISAAGKIIAFISLGILLLFVSFMYQKLKKLVLDEEDSVKSNNEENNSLQ